MVFPKGKHLLSPFSYDYVFPSIVCSVHCIYTLYVILHMYGMYCICIIVDCRCTCSFAYECMSTPTSRVKPHSENYYCTGGVCLKTWVKYYCVYMYLVIRLTEYMYIYSYNVYVSVIS